MLFYKKGSSVSAIERSWKRTKILCVYASYDFSPDVFVLQKLERYLKYMHVSLFLLEIISFMVLVRALKVIIHEFKPRGNKRSKTPELLRYVYIS
jgi:hypothetical protein